MIRMPNVPLLSVRVSRADYARLSAAAEARGDSLSDFVRRRLASALDECPDFAELPEPVRTWVLSDRPRRRGDPTAETEDIEVAIRALVAGCARTRPGTPERRAVLDDAEGAARRLAGLEGPRLARLRALISDAAATERGAGLAGMFA